MLHSGMQEKFRGVVIAYIAYRDTLGKLNWCIRCISCNSKSKDAYYMAMQNT